jgi:hypothetical protein
MGVEACYWSALYGQFLFMLRLWESSWPGCDRRKDKNILRYFWRDLESYGPKFASENACYRKSFKSLKSYCNYSSLSLFLFLCLKFRFFFVCFTPLLHPQHPYVNFPSCYTASVFHYKHTLQSARLKLPCITWKHPHGLASTSFLYCACCYFCNRNPQSRTLLEKSIVVWWSAHSIVLLHRNVNFSLLKNM